MGSFADRKVDPDPTAVELLVGHGSTSPLGILKESLRVVRRATKLTLEQL